MNYDGHDSREDQKIACPVRIPRTKCSTPLIYVFGGCGFGVGLALFVLGFWAKAFCHWRFVPGSTKCHAVLFYKTLSQSSIQPTCLSLAPNLLAGFSRFRGQKCANSATFRVSLPAQKSASNFHRRCDLRCLPSFVNL